MARVPYPKKEDLPQAERPIYERMERERGGGHIWLALANAPKMLEAVMAHGGRAAKRHCIRASAIRELGVVMVGLVTRSAYEFDHHWNAALQAGVRREQLENLAQFETSPHFDDKERAVLRYAKEATETGVVSDATWSKLRAPFRHAAGDGSGADRRVVQLRGAHPVAARDRARAGLQAQLTRPRSGEGREENMEGAAVSRAAGR